MFGFGKKGKEKSTKSSKEEDRYIERKENEAMWGFLDSAKRQSDEAAKRGGR